MAVEKEDIVAMAPELASLSDAAFALAIADATAELPSAKWGDLHDRAVRLLAAHILSLSPSSSRGAVTGETVGSVSRTYAQPRTSSTKVGSSLDSTPYGAELRRLRRTLGLAYSVG